MSVMKVLVNVSDLWWIVFMLVCRNMLSLYLIIDIDMIGCVLYRKCVMFGLGVKFGCIVNGVWWFY